MEKKFLFWVCAGFIFGLLLGLIVILVYEDVRIIDEEDIRLDQPIGCSGFKTGIACTTPVAVIKCQCEGGEIEDPEPDGTCNPPCQPTLISPGGSNVCQIAIQSAANKCGQCGSILIDSVITSNNLCCMGIVECVPPPPLPSRFAA